MANKLYSFETVYLNGIKGFKKQALIASEDAIKLLQNEYEKINYLKEYDFVPKILEYNDNEHYIIYEYIEGQTMENKTFYNFKDTLKFFEDMCNIIECFHNKKIVHCDLKPGNIILSNQGEIIIIDWGTSTFNNEKIEYGTIKYCPLEQLTQKQAKYCFDIYALGIVMYQIITGKNLFNGYSKEKIIAKKRELNLKVSDYVIGAPKILDEILFKMTNMQYENISYLIKELTKLA